MSKSENIKLALNSFLHTKKIRQTRDEAYFKVDEYDVHITNVPICNCSNFSSQFFCKHVYNLLLFRFKVNIRNKILYKRIWTDQQLQNILKKRCRQPSPPRQQRPDGIYRRRGIRRNQPPSEQVNRISVALLEHVRRQQSGRRQQSVRRLRRDRRRLERRRGIYIPPIIIPSHLNADSPEPPRAPRARIPHPPNFNPHRPLSAIGQERTYSIINPNRQRRLINDEHTCEMQVNNNYNHDEDKCPICIEYLANQLNHVITMCSLCSNNFHDECIDTWIMQRIGSGRYPSCPLCRSVIDM